LKTGCHTRIKDDFELKEVDVQVFSKMSQTKILNFCYIRTIARLKSQCCAEIRDIEAKDTPLVKDSIGQK